MQITITLLDFYHGVAVALYLIAGYLSCRLARVRIQPIVPDYRFVFYGMAFVVWPIVAIVELTFQLWPPTGEET